MSFRKSRIRGAGRGGVRLGLLLALCGATFATAQPPAAETAKPAAMVGQYCLACHNDNLKTAGVSLQGLSLDKVGPDAATWEKVLRKVSSGEMPPAGIPAPEPAVASAFTSVVEAALDHEAAVHPNPGRPAIHRVNRAEYSNAIRDLLALDTDPGELLPGDDSGYGFDNIADVLAVSPVLLERYLLAAGRVAKLATGNPNVKPFREVFKRDRETGFANAGYGRNDRSDLPFGAQGGASLHYYFPLDAEYDITIELNGGGENEGDVHKLRLPVKAGMRTLAVTFLGDSAKPEVAAEGGGRSGPREAPPPMDVRLDGARVNLIDLPRGGEPKLTSIVIEGPYNVAGPGDTPSREKIFSCRPSAGSEEEPCAREILSRLARQAYRRPVNDADIGPLMAIYQIGRREADFDRGIEKALRAMLVSPNFIFRIERDPEGAKPGSVYRISDVELASRLSFFLWSSLPDEELLRLAEQGKLPDDKVLAQQVTRMLADRRSNALVENFAGQWLYLRNVDKVKPDKEIFPEFNAELRRSMRRETELFFQAVLRKNHSILDFLNAGYTYLNEPLAKHYGIPNVYGPQFREVRLNDSKRGGLLGQGSILTVTSYPNRTSVVLRGKWILENLFGMPPPPPPADVPEFKARDSSGKKLSMRESMKLHSTSPACASCHVRMDPIGFSLENYDAVGKWRTEDAGTSIEASGELPGGVKFEGPDGLKKMLANEFRETFASTVAEKLLTYALGRGVEYYDKPSIRAILRETAADDYRLEDMIQAIVKSTPFRMRRTPDS